MRIESLTFLRFFAAIVVVIFHHGKTTALGKLAHPLLVSGPQMVTFFFVLSGFVLMVAYQERERISLGRFYRARIARIAPIYWIALAISWALGLSASHSGWGDLAIHATFLQSWIPSVAYQLNIPGWSVSVEMFFYASFPLLLLWVQRRQFTARALFTRAAIFYAISLGIMIWWRNLPSFDPSNKVSNSAYSYLPLNHLSSFALGMAGGRFFTGPDPIGKDASWRGLALSIGALALIFVSLRYKYLVNYTLDLKMPYSVNFLAPLFLFLIWSLARSKNLLTRGLSCWPLVLLGEASYGIYILQNPVMRLFRSYCPWRRLYTSDNQFYIYVSLLVALSVLSLYLIERPARRWIMSLGSSPRKA